MADMSQLSQMLEELKGKITEIESVISGESGGEGEMSGEQTEMPAMESEEGGMPQGKAKVMAMEEEEPPEIVKRMAGMR